MKRANFPDRRERRRLDALDRDMARAFRGDRAQLDRLVADGHGGSDEAYRLRHRLS